MTSIHAKGTSGLNGDPPSWFDNDPHKVSPPGQFPYTRGIHPEGYRRRLWTMRQYAGFGTAATSNERFHSLISAGETGLSVAFDLPTQMGYDSDNSAAMGEVGKVGVAIDSLLDMETLFDGIPLDEVTTSMTINAPAAVLLLLYELVAEKRGISPKKLGGTVQNDILKEYAARGTYIFPPHHSMRLVTDVFAYCGEHMPRWNPISVSGYHYREAGATAVQEIALTIADGIAYIEAAQKVNILVDNLAPKMSFFFNVSNNFCEEVAKFRAARAVWAIVMKERFDSHNERSSMLRFHAQTSGATLTAQQPYNNIIRVAIQALAAVCGGTQSLHTNSFDEALALPSHEAAEIALRTQQVIAFESGITDVTDPLGGSYYIESLTDQLIEQSRGLIKEIDSYGGAVQAIQQGFYQKVIAESAYKYQKDIEQEKTRVVGVNTMKDSAFDRREVTILRVDERGEQEQVARLQSLRRKRNVALVENSLTALRRGASSQDNLLPLMKEALSHYATLGEVCAALKTVFGVYEPMTFI